MTSLPFPAATVYALLADLSGHFRWVPLTSTSAPARPAAPGDELVAVTLGFLVDRMTVTEAHPPAGTSPGVLALRKTGPVLLGPVSITVRPTAASTCSVDWREDVWLRGPLPAAVTRAVLAVPLRAMTRLALWRVGRHLARQATPSPSRSSTVS